MGDKRLFALAPVYLQIWSVCRRPRYCAVPICIYLFVDAVHTGVESQSHWDHHTLAWHCSAVLYPLIFGSSNGTFLDFVLSPLLVVALPCFLSIATHPPSRLSPLAFSTLGNALSPPLFLSYLSRPFFVCFGKRITRPPLLGRWHLAQICWQAR